MKSNILQLYINNHETVLSSKSLFYKTEFFMRQAKHHSCLDILLTKICETITQNLNDITYGEKQTTNSHNCFLVETSDKKYSFLFKLGYQINNSLDEHDIVFVDYLSHNNSYQNTVSEYLSTSPTIKIVIKKEKQTSDYSFNKLYQIMDISDINLPKLDNEQRNIVEMVDKNVLVQGVAGSGKTNICIDKIIYTACRNYSGKVLYSTFNRGLLIDTRLRVEAFKNNLEAFLQKYKNNQLKFLDSNHKKALENRLGIYFFANDDNQIFDKIAKIIDYLNNKVDYLLIEDIYKNKTNTSPKFIGEDYFINDYPRLTKNHQIEKYFAKLSNYSKEVIFKEIYGMILGSCDINSGPNTLTLEDYTIKRENSFTRQECESIYQIALDYKRHCSDNNLLDNNSASLKLLEKINDNFEYSLSIIDEVQDYTQINLYLFKLMSMKMFCVGDALQMINPSFFSFGYLKNLLYEKNLIDIKVLKSNYRNTEKITNIIDNLNEVNRREFGTHNFVIAGKSINDNIESTTIFSQDANLIRSISTGGYEDITFIVSTQKQKDELKKIIKNQEVLTVSEIKGLERNNIVVYNILSSNADKWKMLKRIKVNHKSADENSVFRYYYNLFYVGLSRAKQNIIVFEKENVEQFEKFLIDNFNSCDNKQAIAILDKIVSKAEFSQEELISRINEFVKLEQFNNARFTANKIKNDTLRIDTNRYIDVYEKHIRHGEHREAGIKFWEFGMIDRAKEQFTISKDTILIELIDTCSRNSSNDLNIDIVNYFDEVRDNKVAQSFIIETVKKDVATLKKSFATIKENFKKGRK